MTQLDGARQGWQGAPAGKDTTTGHWEMAGIVLERPFPTYPNGFPPEVIEPFEAAIGRKVLGNEVASGTEIIERLGEEHVRTGRPIVYTSADSVFQIATHVDVVPLEQLYEWCRTARRILTGDHPVGRVIVILRRRAPGRSARTPDRRDFSVALPGPTLPDALTGGDPVYGVGKIRDIFDGHGLTEFRYSRSNDDGVDVALGYLERPTVPHLRETWLTSIRSTAIATIGGLRARDRGAGCPACPRSSAALDGGVLLMTGDHGCDPTTPGTDHSRERTPVLAAGLDAGPLRDRDARDVQRSQADRRRSAWS